MLVCDQAMYITAARGLLDGKPVEFTCQEAGFVNETKRNFYYMPGHVVLLAGTYAALGYGPWQSILPSLAGFVLSCVLLFLLVRDRYGEYPAWVSLACFLGYPFLYIVVPTAMSDVTAVAATLLVLYLFTRLRGRARFWVGVLLPILPFYFKETTAVVIFVMAALYLQAPVDRRALRTAVAFVSLSTLILGVVYMLPPSSDRVNPFTSLLLGGDNTLAYRDAVAREGLRPTAGELAQKVAARGWAQTKDFIAGLRPDLRGLEYLFILGAVPLGFFLFYRRGDYFLLAVALATLVSVAAVLLLYVTGHIGKRNLLPVVALDCIAYGVALAPVLRRAGVTLVPGVVLGAVLLAGCYYLTRREWQTILRHDAELAVFDEAAEPLAPPDGTVLIADYDLSCDYLLRHYPVKIFSVPRNRQTLAMILSKYPVGMVCLPLAPLAEREKRTEVTLEDLNKAGFELKKEFAYEGVTFGLAVRKPRADGARLLPKEASGGGE